MTSSNAATSRAASRWIASAVFFLLCQRLLDGTRAADLLVDGQQFPAEFAELMKRFDLALHLAQFCRRGEAFADCFSIHLAGQTIVRAVAQLARPVAAAIGLATAPRDGADRTTRKVTQIEHPPENRRALLFKYG
jgi:hypothetical protein